MQRALWYAEGFRWLGGLLNGAADHFERSAARMANLDPRARSQFEDELDQLKSRSHLQG